ncbi:MAG: PAS domain S-box protein, partial [Salinigranum sp.]
MTAVEPLPDALAETLAVFERVAAGRDPLTASEVAESLDCTRRTAYDRLQRLTERGELETKKVGARGRVWWRTAGAGTGGDPGSGGAAEFPLPCDVLDAVDVACLLADGDGDVARANGAFERFFGVDREGLLGRDVGCVVREDLAAVVEDPEEFAAADPAALDGDDSPFECRITAADGREERWLERRVVPIETGRYAGGRAVVYRDVTERSRTRRTLEGRRRALREERAFVESLLDSQQDVIYAFDEEGRLRRWNDRCVEVTGYSEEELDGAHVLSFVPEEDADRVEAAIERIVEEGESVTTEVPLRTAGGDYVPHEFTGGPLTDEAGTVVGFTGVGRDVRGREERERELARERALLERILEASPVFVAVFDSDGRFLRGNSPAKEVLSVSDERVRVDEDVRILDPEGRPLSFAENPLGRTLATEEGVTAEPIQIVRDDERRWLSVTTAALRDEDGEIERVATCAEDVTRLQERARRLEHQRNDLQRELEEVFERVSDGFFALDEEWRFTYVNDRAATLLDTPASALLGRSIRDLFPAVAAPESDDALARAVESQRPVTYEEYFPPTGTWFDVTAYPSETGVSVYFRDVTERKERERELQHYRMAIEAADDGVFMVDGNERLVLANDAFCEHVGYEREELLGRPASLVLDDDVYDRIVELSGEMRAEERSVSTIEFERTTADGETIPVESRFSLYESDEGGFGRTGIVRDISERKERERELQRYQTVVETTDNGVYMLDEDNRFLQVSDAYCDLVGYDPEELIGEDASKLLTEDVQEAVDELCAEMRAGERDVAVIEFDLLTADGGTVPAESHFGLYEYADGSVGRTGVVRDVTERRERER